jgi:flagellar basal-body rod protein FlgB
MIPFTPATLRNQLRRSAARRSEAGVERLALWLGGTAACRTDAGVERLAIRLGGTAARRADAGVERSAIWLGEAAAEETRTPPAGDPHTRMIAAWLKELLDRTETLLRISGASQAGDFHPIAFLKVYPPRQDRRTVGVAKKFPALRSRQCSDAVSALTRAKRTARRPMNPKIRKKPTTVSRYRTAPFWPPSCIPSFAVIDSLTDSLEQYMDLVSLRQKLVASNIANADTPGYKTQDLDFQSSFRSALDGGSPETVQVTGLKTKNDGNNVDLDREARLLAENAMRFSVASNLMHSAISQVKEAISGGKGA